MTTKKTGKCRMSPSNIKLSLMQTKLVLHSFLTLLILCTSQTNSFAQEVDLTNLFGKNECIGHQDDPTCINEIYQCTERQKDYREALSKKAKACQNQGNCEATIQKCGVEMQKATDLSKISQNILTGKSSYCTRVMVAQNGDEMKEMRSDADKESKDLSKELDDLRKEIIEKQQEAAEQANKLQENAADLFDESESIMEDAEMEELNRVKEFQDQTRQLADKIKQNKRQIEVNLSTGLESERQEYSKAVQQAMVSCLSEAKQKADVLEAEVKADIANKRYAVKGSLNELSQSTNRGDARGRRNYEVNLRYGECMKEQEKYVLKFAKEQYQMRLDNLKKRSEHLKQDNQEIQTQLDELAKNTQAISDLMKRKASRQAKLKFEKALNALNKASQAEQASAALNQQMNLTLNRLQAEQQQQEMIRNSLPMGPFNKGDYERYNDALGAFQEIESLKEAYGPCCAAYHTPGLCEGRSSGPPSSRGTASRPVSGRPTVLPSQAPPAMRPVPSHKTGR